MKFGDMTLKVNVDTDELMEKLIRYDLENPTKLQLKRVSETVNLPFYGTQKSSRFDLHAALDHVTELTCYTDQNIKIKLPVNKHEDGNFIDVPPQARVLIPTGFIFGIPEDYELTIVPRSSAAGKLGLAEANNVGVIDQDYREETFLLILNISSVPVRVKHNDRISQGKLVPTFQTLFEEVDVLQEVVSDRDGGFGSTTK
jgi:dUTP pyrophosphatase